VVLPLCVDTQKFHYLISERTMSGTRKREPNSKEEMDASGAAISSGSAMELEAVVSTVNATRSFTQLDTVLQEHGTHKSELIALPNSSWKIFFLKKENAGVFTMNVYRTDDGLSPVEISGRIKFANALREKKIEKTWVRPRWCPLTSAEKINLFIRRFTSDQLREQVVAAEGVVRVEVELSETSYPSAQRDVERCLLGCAALDLTSIFPMVSITAGSSSLQASLQIAQAGSQRFQVPRKLLCAHSPVLEVMLNSSMAESGGHIDMAGTPVKAIGDWVLCLLNGGLVREVAQCTDRVTGVLILCDKYEVDALSDACTWTLTMTLSRNNVAERLAVSDEHGLTKLRLAALKFAASTSDRMNAVTGSTEYSTYSPSLLRDLMAHQNAPPQSDPPVYLQWGNDYEFTPETCWTGLDPQAVRRACLERHLATTGSLAELLARLGADPGPDANKPKRRRVCRE